MAEVKPGWRYNLTNVTATRRASRTATPAGMAARLIGVDGNRDGGLRPSTGFKSVVDLTYGFGTDAELLSTNGLNKGGRMTAWEPITFSVGDAKYAYGFLYQVLNDTETKAIWRLKIRVGDSLTWLNDADMGKVQGLTAPEDWDGEQAQVAMVGRFVYVFRSSKRPFVFYLDEPTPGNYTLVVTETTGPGPVPELINPAKNSASALITVGGGRTANQDVTEVVPAMTAPAGDLDASARVVYFGFSGLHQVSSDGVTYVSNPALQIRNLPSPTITDQALNGPSDLGLWAVPPQPDPTFLDVDWWVNGVRSGYSYPAPPSANHEREDWGWNKGARASNTPMGFTHTSFVWAYRLFDSTTGRLSQLSTRLESGSDGYGDSGVIEEVNTELGSKNSNIIPITFPMIQIIYDSTRYDTMLLYRGRTAQGLTADETILSLEASVTLADYLIDTQPAAPWKVAAYFPVLSDEELNVQETFQGDDVYLEQMPYAGSVIPYEGALLMGAFGQLDDTIGGLGKVMWSSLLEISPELVPPSNRYTLEMPDEEINRFHKLGPNVLALSRQNPYLFRREITHMKAQIMHGGYGIPGHRASCQVGSSVFYITEHGLQKVNSQGQLTDLGVINEVIQLDWAPDLDVVEMAYDTPSSVVFLLNPNAEEAVALWVRADRMTEFVDMTFIHVKEGDVPYSVGTLTRLQKRAVFVQYIRTNATDYKWRVFVYDYNRTKGTVTTLQPSGNLILTLAQPYLAGTTTFDAVESVPLNAEGAVLYVLDGPYVGWKLTVNYRVSANRLDVQPKMVSLPSGTKFSVSPMYFEWVGSALGLENEEGFEYGQNGEFHAVRHVDSLVASFTSVTYSGVDDTEARYEGTVYLGNATMPADKRFPEDNRRAQVQSVMNGASVNAAAFSDPLDTDAEGRTGVQGNAVHPGVRIFVSDLDFQLLSVRVTGTIRDEDTMRRRD